MEATGTDVCRWCSGFGRMADDVCRPCSGTGAAVGWWDGLEPDGLQEAVRRAKISLRGLLPYLPKFPAATEQRVRQAMRSLEEVAHGN